MKKTILTMGILFSASALLAACGPTEEKPNPGPEKPDKITFTDTRKDLFTVVSGEMVNGVFEPDGQTKDFKSLYEAANYTFDNCELGSFVKAKGDDTNTILFQKRANQESVSGSNIDDQWFYYRDGIKLDGYSKYLTGDTEFFKGEKVSRLMVSTDNLKQTYQPYKLLRRDASASTAAWNLLPLLDASVRYNPQAFTGIREITYDFALSQGKIRPSYNAQQKVVPTITLSQTDSYNWSNQGIYMDTDTGNWYYLFGETQSDFKQLEYDKKEVLLTSTWDEANQEWTPNGDVKMTLKYNFNTTEETWSNDLIIEVTSKGETKTYNKNYEYTQMNGRGTPRANIAMDLISNDKMLDEGMFAPDYMCGAYFKNITVKDASGKVPEGLTNEDYAGDTDMCCKPGQTYDLSAGADKNDANLDVILDHNAKITYDETKKDIDVFTISYEQIEATEKRTKEVLDVEKLIANIKDTDTKDSPSVIKAATAFNKLDGKAQKVVTKIDGFNKLETILG